MCYTESPKVTTERSVVCCCKLNVTTQVCDEHLFGQVSTHTGRSQLPILHCTNESEWAHNIEYQTIHHLDNYPLFSIDVILGKIQLVGSIFDVIYAKIGFRGLTPGRVWIYLKFIHSMPFNFKSFGDVTQDRVFLSCSLQSLTLKKVHKNKLDCL